jgi:alpha-tubulin suppressor-like RCC1 family protein
MIFSVYIACQMPCLDELARGHHRHILAMELRGLRLLLLSVLVPSIVPFSATHWRLVLTQNNPNGWENWFYEIDFKNLAGTTFAGTFTSNRGNLNIGLLSDNLENGGYQWPPSAGYPAIGDHIQFACSAACDVSAVYISQYATPSNRAYRMELYYSTDSGVSYLHPWGDFDTNSQYVTYSIPVPTAAPTRSPTLSPTRTPTLSPTPAPTLTGNAAYWRLRWVQNNPHGFENYFYSMQFYDSQGSPLTGTFSTNRGNTDTAYLTDGNGATAMEFPQTPGTFPVIGDYIQFICAPYCEVRSLTFQQWYSVANWVMQLSLDYSLDNGATWVSQWPAFNAGSQFVTYNTIPTTMPTAQPSLLGPTPAPTAKPTLAPTANPTTKPTASPIINPTLSPSTVIPTARPSAKPTVTPTAQPSMTPTAAPTTKPTVVPTSSPTAKPTATPTAPPTVVPSTLTPTAGPTAKPSTNPSVVPTARPTTPPTQKPSTTPTVHPTADPSVVPSLAPTAAPNALPTTAPTFPVFSTSHWRLRWVENNVYGWDNYFFSMLFSDGSGNPLSGTFSTNWGNTDTAYLTDNDPNTSMRFPPVTNGQWNSPVMGDYIQFVCLPYCEVRALTFVQWSSFTNWVLQMSLDYSQDNGATWISPYPPFSTSAITVVYSTVPTMMPTEAPTIVPTCKPSASPTCVPSEIPSALPSTDPTAAPSAVPSERPTAEPTTAAPTVTPTAPPSYSPTMEPSGSPTAEPTTSPTPLPTPQPSGSPSSGPSSLPSGQPSSLPTSQPTPVRPSSSPSTQPSSQPSTRPSTSHMDSILTSPSYKTRNGFAFAAVSANGITRTWGEMQYGGDSSAVAHLLGSNVSRVIAGRFSFAALKTNGSVAVWGAQATSGGFSRAISNVVATELAFAGIEQSTGAVVAFGSKHHGGDVQDNEYCNGYAVQLSSGVSSLAASAAAFAAIKTDGSVLAWGSKHAGADVAAGVLASLTGAQMVMATMSAFAMLLSDGTVAAWGERTAGGDTSAVADQVHGVFHLVATRSTFVAFKRTSGLVVWGAHKNGGDVTSVASRLSSHVASVAYTYSAMAAVKADGSVVTWGKAASGGDSSAVEDNLVDVVRVFGNSRAFAALTSRGGVVAWGNPTYGGSIPVDKLGTLSSGVVSIYHTHRAFAALEDDGSLVVWGQAGHGGSPGSTVEALLTSGVHTVCANDVAFSAIKTDGSVVAWGHSVSVPDPGVQLLPGSLTVPNVQCA